MREYPLVLSISILFTFTYAVQATSSWDPSAADYSGREGKTLR